MWYLFSVLDHCLWWHYIALISKCEDPDGRIDTLNRHKAVSYDEDTQ